MHCHCGTNNRAPRWTFTDPCKLEVRPGAREESASPAWLAASAMDARNITKVDIWRLDTGCGPTLYRKCHSHNTPGTRSKPVESYIPYKKFLLWPPPLIWGSVLLYLRSPKGGCYSTSDDLSLCFNNYFLYFQLPFGDKIK